jgi:hypothetical protein
MSNKQKAREEKTKIWVTQQAERAIKMRNKDRDFHGLEREFMYAQVQMLQDYEKSKDVGHPRDVGDIREEILYKFLAESGYVPSRYGLASTRVRVASPSGHLSKELDIVFRDPLDSISLMRREGIYEVLPVESVYGVIQVKSRLTKEEIVKGLDNIASFKQLVRDASVQTGPFHARSPMTNRGFGFLFAYDSDLVWSEIVRLVEEFAKANDKRVWANGVFILKQGLILHGDGTLGRFQNYELDQINEVKMFGFPDRQGAGLYNFYRILLSVLRATRVHPVPQDSYYRLPLIAGARSYEFCLGSFAEVGHCAKHGDFQRVIKPAMLDRLIAWCANAEPINFVKALDIAGGGPGDRNETYARQPGKVIIYNPETRPLPEILMLSNGSLAFDEVRIGMVVVCVPYYYSAKEGIISDCPKCRKKREKKV